MLSGRDALDPALRLRDRLLGDHDHVTCLETTSPLDRVADQSWKVVACGDLRDPGKRDDADLAHGRSVIVIPVCAL